MSDWKFGDVLEHNSHPHATRVLFLGRPDGPPRYENGVWVFWGFEGIYLQPDCPETGDDPGTVRPCGNGHFLGHRGNFGGDPDAPHRNDAWSVIDSLGPPSGVRVFYDGKDVTDRVIVKTIGSSAVQITSDLDGPFEIIYEPAP